MSLLILSTSLADLLQGTRGDRLGDSPLRSRTRASSKRVSSIKMAFEEELRGNSPMARKKGVKHQHGGDVSRPDSRPASPCSPAMASPRSMKKFGVKMGFSLSFLLKSLMKAADSVETRESRRFLDMLSLIRRLGKGCEALDRLVKRKRLNHKFHTLLRIKQNVVHTSAKFAVRESGRPTILPVEISSSSMPLRIITILDNASVAEYAGAGKIVGTILSIHRIHKLDVFKQFYNVKSAGIS